MNDRDASRSMARKYGYVRPTALPADAQAQAENLAAAGAETIFIEKSTPQARRGMRERRRLFDQIKPGDTLILQSLDRLGTTLEDILHGLALLAERGVRFEILEPSFETAPNLAHLDLLRLLTGAHTALRSETIKLNLAAARAKGGRKAGSPHTLAPEQWPEIQARINATSLTAVAAELKVSRQTLWTYRRRMAGEHDVAKR